MSTNYQLGRQGEAAAAKFLTTNGYQILERNYRYLKAEVDIIAKKNNSLVAIEIKTRSSDFFGAPETFLKPQQQQRIVGAIDHYVKQNKLDVDVRFDIISILKKGHKLSINHIPNAFYHF